MAKGLQRACAASAVVGLLMLLSGCPAPSPSSRGEGAAATSSRSGTEGQVANTTVLTEVPDTGPGLTAGTYAMIEEKLAAPVRVGAGPAFTASGDGAWSALLFDAPKQITLALTDVGGGKFTLGAAVREGGKDAGTQTLEATQSEAKGDVTWVVFEGLEVANTKVSLGVEVPKADGARMARSSYVQKSCETAQVKSGEGTVAVRRVMDTVRRPLGSGKALWVDLDGDGDAQEWEMAPEGTVGVAGRLCNLKVSDTGKPSLEVSEFSGQTGVVVFSAKDGRGQQAGVCGPSFGGSQTVKYLGIVKAAQVPAGSVAIAYIIPGEGTSAGVATVPRQVKVEAGKAVSLEAGGPVEIKVTAQAQSGNVLGTVSLSTATGHDVGGGSGESATGVVEVLDPDGKVLSTSNAEFG